jgi:hypothetical protein
MFLDESDNIPDIIAVNTGNENNILTKQMIASKEDNECLSMANTTMKTSNTSGGLL